MAEILSTLSSDGLAGTPTLTGDRYVLMNTWQSAQQASTGSGDSAVLECYKGTTVEGAWQADGSLEENIIIDGWVTDETNTITIRAAAGEGHGGVVGEGFTVAGASNYADTLDINDPYVYLSNFSVTANRQNACIEIRQHPCFINNVICVSADPTNSFYVQIKVTASNVGISEVKNCLCISGYVGILSFANRRLKVYNNTAIDCRTGMSLDDMNADSEVINNVAYNSTLIDFNAATINGTFSNSASGDTSAPGTAPQTGVVEADFADYAGGDYSPAPAGKLDGTGADLSADFTTDIAGANRTAPWTIGAYIVAGGPPPVGVENMRVKVGGVWVNATPSIKVGSQWVSVDAYVKVGAAWVPVYEQ